MKLLKMLVPPTVIGLALYLNIPSLTIFILCLLWVVIVMGTLVLFLTPMLVKFGLDEGEESKYQTVIDAIKDERNFSSRVLGWIISSICVLLLIALSAPVTAAFYWLLKVLMEHVMNFSNNMIKEKENNNE